MTAVGHFRESLALPWEDFFSFILLLFIYLDVRPLVKNIKHP